MSLLRRRQRREHQSYARRARWGMTGRPALITVHPESRSSDGDGGSSEASRPGEGEALESIVACPAGTTAPKWRLPGQLVYFYLVAPIVATPLLFPRFFS